MGANAWCVYRAQVVLSDHPGVGPLPVVLPERVLSELRAAGVRYQIVERELDRTFAAERERQRVPRRRVRPPL